MLEEAQRCFGGTESSAGPCSQFIQRILKQEFRTWFLPRCPVQQSFCRQGTADNRDNRLAMAELQKHLVAVAPV